MESMTSHNFLCLTLPLCYDTAWSLLLDALGLLSLENHEINKFLLFIDYSVSDVLLKWQKTDQESTPSLSPYFGGCWFKFHLLVPASRCLRALSDPKAHRELI